VAQSQNRPNLTPQDIQSMLYTYQMLEQQLESMHAERAAIARQIENFERTKSTVLGLKGKEEGHEVIFPVGIVYFKAKIVEPEKVLVNLGADRVVEKTPDEAIEYLDNIIKNMTGFIEKADKDIDKTTNDLVRIKPMVDAIYNSMGRNMRSQMGGSKPEDK
jgi:prefoldin alpha subunit